MRVSLDLQVLQKWFTYQNLQDLIRKTNTVLSIRSAQGLLLQNHKTVSDQYFQTMFWQIPHCFSPSVQLVLMGHTQKRMVMKGFDNT